MATDTKTLDEQKHLIYDIAEAIAPTWEQRRADVEEVATPGPGMDAARASPARRNTVLELAAGVGETGFEAAAIVGEAGRLITSDFSPAMLEAARRRGAELGVANADYRIIDGERIELDDDSVDGVLCRFGYMLMPDSAAAFAETRRVLRPGGRLALAVWGALERNPFFAIIGITLVERGHIAPPGPRRHRGRSAWRARNGSTGSSGTPVSPRCASRKCMAVRRHPGRRRVLELVVIEHRGPIRLALRGLAEPTVPWSGPTWKTPCGASRPRMATSFRRSTPPWRASPGGERLDGPPAAGVSTRVGALRTRVGLARGWPAAAPPEERGRSREGHGVSFRRWWRPIAGTSPKPRLRLVGPHFQPGTRPACSIHFCMSGPCVSSSVLTLT